MIKRIFGITALVVFSGFATAQEQAVDSVKVEEAAVAAHDDEEGKPLKLHHAEPLYIDLMRDLGARKGEREWNVAMGVTENNGYYEFYPLVEYEWAVADRLSLEVEVPFNVYTSAEKLPHKSPGTGVAGIKTSIQYTFLVNKKAYTSMAVGYLNEIELNSFRNYGNGKFFTGNVYNPFFVVAKGWGKTHSISTMVYAGPVFTHHFGSNHVDTDWQINSSIHYLIPNSRNFVGLEVNKSITKERFNMVLRPQIRVALNDNTILGLVVGVPTNRQYEGYSGFIRLVYEPPHKKH